MNGETYKGVPVPDGMRPNWNTPEAFWWMRGVQAALDIAVPLLDALVDEGACRFDRHGYCQEHWGLGAEGACVNEEVREFLAETAPEEVWRSTAVTDPCLYWCIPHRPALAVTRVRLSDIHPSVEIQCVQCGRAAR